MKIIISSVFVLVFATLCYAQNAETPDWAKKLIIYEISTKNFTSPKGYGTGTFASATEKVRYLAELGITGVWLAGHNLADDDHFYGIWTQYATIRPDSIDPTLGTRTDLRKFVDECHKNGIKVFLDIITHGVMSNSPLIKEHPEWFKGGSWGMTDYDWQGKHADLDKWWVDTHVKFVRDCNIDGFRLDVDIYRPDLWHDIKNRCTANGSPITVFLEGAHANNRACDFFQRMTTISDQRVGLDSVQSIIFNAARFFKEPIYLVNIYFHDGSSASGTSEGIGRLKIKTVFRPKFIQDYSNVKENDYIDLYIENIDSTKRITYMTITSNGTSWQLGSPTQNWTRLRFGSSMHLYLEPVEQETALRSVQLSSHDDGWESFPKQSNPYVAEGSRCTFGYSFLFTPAIPLFMSGEEFNAQFVPNPKLTPDLYGKEAAGQGKWLYGAIIDWNQLQNKEQKAMLDDVKKMIAIRKQESDIFCADWNNKEANIQAIEYTANSEIPVPFLLSNNKKIIVVAGNNTSKNVECTLKLNLQQEGLNAQQTYTIVDLWNNKTMKVKGENLQNYTFTINKDKTAGGGIIVFKIVK